MLIDDLDQLLARRNDDIEAWFSAREQNSICPFYYSVDIRNAGYKIAVVDTNVFPAGFNNLCDYSYRLGADQVRAYFDRHYPDVRRVLIVPESATRNPGYTANLARLEQMTSEAGYEVAIGTLIESVPSTGAELTGHEDTKVRLMPFELVEGIPHVAGKPFDAVVLNHDLSGGEPDAVRDIRVPVIPRRSLGWHRRRKSVHFAMLREVTESFAEAFELDPWRLGAETVAIDDVSFSEPSEGLRDGVKEVFAHVHDNYMGRGIEEPPYVFVKHDAGTYGMGVLALQDPDELETLSRQLRKKMRMGKGGAEISSVIVQEGLPTVDRVRDCVGEPVIYAMNNHIVGGFFRMNCALDARASLNKPGQVYARLCSTPTPEQSRGGTCFHDSRYFRVYGLFARLAGLAVMAEADALEKRT